MATIPRHENWSEHQTTMFSSLHEKQRQGKFCDVILKCSDSERTFNAHSCVLSAASKVLDTILNETMENKEPGTTKLIVTLPDEVTSSCLDSLLNFIYSGNIDLNLKTPKASGSGTLTRKSKRNFAKVKNTQGDDTSESNPDIPLLYAFLKASRRLEIQTLTEHLESAVTLSEMKMSDSRDASVVEEISTAKKHASECTVTSDENMEYTANHDMNKKFDVDHDNTAASNLKSFNCRKSGRLLEKAAVDAGSMEEQQHCGVENTMSATNLNEITETADYSETPEDSEDQIDPVIVGASPEIDEVEQAVTSPQKSRIVRKMQCPTCQKIFRSVDMYEVHMKNHINEIEIALSNNKEKNTVSIDAINATERNDNRTIDVVSLNRLDTSHRTSERPKRASTAKFHEMMRSTFGADHNITVSPKNMSLQTVAVTETENNSDMHSLILTKVDENTLVVESIKEDPVEQIVLEEGAVEEGVVVVESAKNTWHTVDNERALDVIDGDSVGEEDVEGTILSFVPVEEDMDLGITQGRSKAKGRKKRDKTNTCDDDSQICSECGKAVPNMKAHLRIHARSLPCHICGETFKYRSALTRHMHFHTEEGLSCSTCGEKVFSQRDMTKHMAKHNLKKMRTECPDCKKSFTSEYVMQLHRRTHTGEEKFACNICSKRFPYKSSLKMHMLLHTGEKPYICSICGKCFVQKIHAKEHELQHQGIKRQFQCPICRKNFAHKCGLTRHIADIHNKSRPFVCDTCGKSFPRKTKLIEHKRMHTGEKPYICELCGMRYKANRSLKCHKKTEHGILVADYQVGIWRKGPIPPSPESERRKAAGKRKAKQINTSRDGGGNKSLLSFPFPVSSEDANLSAVEEDIMTGISEHVAAITGRDHAGQDFTTNDEKTAQHFSYPIPEANQNFQGQFTTLAEVSNYPSHALPPASTLTKSDQSNPLAYPMLGALKTFIVPLTSSAHPSVPVVVDPNPSQIDQTQVPGMMVTYMMPPQPYTITEATSVSNGVTPDHAGTRLPDASRSASVPPMSTFSRSSNVTAALKANSPIQALPGMYTFQPGMQFRVTSTDMNAEIIEIDSQPEVQVIPENQHLLPASPVEEVPALAEEVTVQQQQDEWTDEYSS